MFLNERPCEGLPAESHLSPCLQKKNIEAQVTHLENGGTGMGAEF